MNFLIIDKNNDNEVIFAFSNEHLLNYTKDAYFIDKIHNDEFELGDVLESDGYIVVNISNNIKKYAIFSTSEGGDLYFNKGNYREIVKDFSFEGEILKKFTKWNNNNQIGDVFDCMDFYTVGIVRVE